MKRIIFLACFLLIACHQSERPLVAPSEGASPAPISGTDVGNGGDHLRAMFINMGEAVLGFLREDESGREIAAKKFLNLERLQATLTTKRIAVVAQPLLDNTGSLVDALGGNGQIKLFGERWLDHFEKERDVYYLVFHEMLRSAGVPDDDFVISHALFPFPSVMRITTRLIPSLPLVASDLVAPQILEQDIRLGGGGCSVGKNSFVDFDREANKLVLTFATFFLRQEMNSSEAVSRTNCTIAIPVRARPLERVTVTQVDLTGRVSLPREMEASATSEVFTPGTRGQRTQKDFSKEKFPLDGRFQFRSKATAVTPCGGMAIIRLNTGLTLARPSEGSASVRYDKIHLYLMGESCEEEVP